MPLPAILIALPFFGGFALLGRWLQLHPEKLPPRGSFSGPNSTGARVYKFQIFLVGSFAVFSGTTGAVFVLFSWTAPFYPLIIFALCLISMGVGVGMAIFVRREVRSRPEYVSNDPFGLWP